ILLVLSRKPEAIAVRPAAGRGGEGRGGAPPESRGAGGPPPDGARGAGAPGAAQPAGGGRGPAGPPGSGIPGDSFVRTAGVAWDKDGNIYVADGAAMGAGNARVAKFDKDGHFIASWGQLGRAGRLPKEFNMVNAIDCRSENELFVGELGNWRVQKVALRPGRSGGSGASGK